MNSRAQGFTLPELLVVTLIGAVVLTAVYQTLTIQERTNRQQIAVVSTQQNTRTAVALIASDLREVSAKDGDVLDASSTNIRYRALRKAAVVCTKDFASNSWIDVVLNRQSFAAEDSVLLFQDNANKTAGSDDSWNTARVSSVGTTTNCAASTGTKQRLNFPANAVANVDTGGLVRSYVKVGYRAVNAGSGSSLWRIEQHNGSADSVAVVDSLMSTANEGLRLQYYDSTGTQITPSTSTIRANIMRVEVKARSGFVGGQSGNRRMFSDSLVGNVYLRGNQRSS